MTIEHLEWNNFMAELELVTKLTKAREQAEIYRLETLRWKEANLALTKENAMLAAQVARLRAILVDPYSGPTEAVRIARNTLSESPPEALRQLKREWIGPTIELLKPLTFHIQFLQGEEIGGFYQPSKAELARLTAILKDK